MSHEMVYVSIYWHRAGDVITQKFIDKHPDWLWFEMFEDGNIKHLPAPAADTTAKSLWGTIGFKPLPNGNGFLIDPYESNLDAELDLCGMDEAFGQGDDIEKLLKWFWPQRENDYVFGWYQDGIALYDVYVYTTHTFDGNDSETEYTLLGVLDTSKLHLALAEKAVAE